MKFNPFLIYNFIKYVISKYISLLANILPDLTNLQSLKKPQTVKKFEKKQLLNPQLNPNIKSISPKQSIIITPNPKFDPTSKFALTRAQNGSFEDLNIDEPRNFTYYFFSRKRMNVLIIDISTIYNFISCNLSINFSFILLSKGIIIQYNQSRKATK